ncbi:helix-turn-helix domain-containing protein [Candidatus Nanohalovita haloferacivicina]|uniref:helix-turn-helix domain-containing protein n=1 Tax=Candidatus Nanohalovita haloferacivicina TaxID=2978046 RepID=UPI00325FD3B0|nr:hypothetical protein HBNXNv_0361 [Candidatus Nanohalobia archaeon BNXNv]
MVRDYEEEVMTSLLAYKILRSINRKGQAYPTEIAEDLDTSYQSVNNYMKGLRKRKIVEKSKEEGKKRYYSISPEGIFNTWKQLWLEDLDKETVSSLKRAVQSDKAQKHIEDIENNVGVLVSSYTAGYLEVNEEGNLQDMLYDDFWTSLQPYPTNSEQWLSTFCHLMDILRKTEKVGKGPMIAAIEKTRESEEQIGDFKFFSDLEKEN